MLVLSVLLVIFVFLVIGVLFVSDVGVGGVCAIEHVVVQGSRCRYGVSERVL